MPDHFHAILIIRNRKHDDAGVETPRRGVSTGPRNIHHHVEWQPNSLGSIINQFKSTCTKRIRSQGYINFAWQPRYYDRIIRTKQALRDVRRYIWNNPKKWQG